MMKKSQGNAPDYTNNSPRGEFECKGLIELRHFCTEWQRIVLSAGVVSSHRRMRLLVFVWAASVVLPGLFYGLPSPIIGIKGF